MKVIFIWRLTKIFKLICLFTEYLRINQLKNVLPVQFQFLIFIPPPLPNERIDNLQTEQDTIPYTCKRNLRFTIGMDWIAGAGFIVRLNQMPIV